MAGQQPEVPSTDGCRLRRPRPKLPAVDESLAEMAAYFRARTRLPDGELARLTLAARASGSRWDAIAAACGVTTHQDLTGVICWITGDTGAELLFSATQQAIRKLTGGERHYPPLTWTCTGCGQQVTERAPAGRPVHVEHGHAPDCTRLARDQAAEDQRCSRPLRMSMTATFAVAR